MDRRRTPRVGGRERRDAGGRSAAGPPHPGLPGPDLVPERVQQDPAPGEPGRRRPPRRAGVRRLAAVRDPPRRPRSPQVVGAGLAPPRRTKGTATMKTAALAVLLIAGAAPAQETKVVNVLTTTTDLAAIAREVGGDAVKVSSLAKGPEDPHFLDARPSFARMARDADLFVKVGLDLEAGYEGPIVLQARNPRIQPGTPGYCDASAGVDLLEVPAGTVDRGLGDVHAGGNPHYLLDPVRAKGVA